VIDFASGVGSFTIQRIDSAVDAEDHAPFAVAERFIQTLKVELIWTRDWTGLDELREAVTRWLDVYNHVRPHEALGGMTFAEKRAENLGIAIQQAA